MSRRSIVYLLVGVSLSCMNFMCGGGSSINEGKKKVVELQFTQAINVFKKVYTSSKNPAEKAEAAINVAEAYRSQGFTKDAERWYNNAIRFKSTNPLITYRLAQILMFQEKWEDAIQKMHDYQKLNPDDTNGQLMIDNCALALKWRKERSRYIVENARILNTKFFDFAPAYLKKDQIIFTSDRESGKGKNPYGWTGYSFSDLYESAKNKKNGTLGLPVSMKGKINTKFNDGSAQFDKKGVGYVTQCNGPDGKGKRCNIYKIELKGKEGWDEPELLSFNNDSNFSCSQPTISPDGNVLYFTSDMPGGFGYNDIWFVTYSKKSKSWSDPINAGPTINTAMDEVYPWMHEDGTLFFASNGHPGMGGMDIFYATGQGKSWENVKNMRYPINTGADDFALICDEKKETGYLTSNRPGGKGNDDIYSFKMGSLEIDLVGKITDCKTGEPLANVNITITNSIDTSRIRLKTDATGSYRTKKNLKANAEYSVYGEKREDYYFDSKVYDVSTFNIEVSTTLRQDFCLRQINLDEVFTVRGIYYGLDSADIHTRAISMYILDSLAGILDKYSKITIELGSHTDCRASYDYNINLSQRRADSAVAYLVSMGIDLARLTAKGYGETQLTNDCACEGEKEPGGGPYIPFINCSEDIHQLNRRTTVRITGKSYKKKK